MEFGGDGFETFSCGAQKGVSLTMHPAIQSVDHAATSSNDRFDWVLQHLPLGPRYPFDVELYGDRDAAVIPTVGALTPAWVLIVPRKKSACVADMDSHLRGKVGRLSKRAMKELSRFDGTPFLFEHGARSAGSPTGCGVDQAHLHVVNLKENLLELTLKQRSLDWVLVSQEDPWESISPGREYLLISDFEDSYVSYPPNGTSQFFRRLVAEALSCNDEWDYRSFEHEQNASETVRLLRRID